MFMYRWMNGDVSFVSACTKEDATVMLDEWAIQMVRRSAKFGLHG